MDNNFYNQVCYDDVVLVELDSDWAVSFGNPTHNQTAAFWKRVGFARLFLPRVLIICLKERVRGQDEKYL